MFRSILLVVIFFGCKSEIYEKRNFYGIADELSHEGITYLQIDDLQSFSQLKQITDSLECENHLIYLRFLGAHEELKTIQINGDCFEGELCFFNIGNILYIDNGSIRNHDSYTVDSLPIIVSKHYYNLEGLEYHSQKSSKARIFIKYEKESMEDFKYMLQKLTLGLDKLKPDENIYINISPRF